MFSVPEAYIFFEQSDLRRKLFAFTCRPTHEGDPNPVGDAQRALLLFGKFVDTERGYQSGELQVLAHPNGYLYFSYYQWQKWLPEYEEQYEICDYMDYSRDSDVLERNPFATVSYCLTRVIKPVHAPAPPKLPSPSPVPAWRRWRPRWIRGFVPEALKERLR